MISLVPYARFLEIRQRRADVRAEISRQPVAPPPVDSREREVVVIDCEGVADKSGRAPSPTPSPVSPLTPGHRH